MSMLAGMMAGFLAWFVVRYVVGGIYTVDQNERAVKTVFGRAQRLGTATVTDGELGAGFDADERALVRARRRGERVADRGVRPVQRHLRVGQARGDQDRLGHHDVLDRPLPNRVPLDQRL